VAVILHPTLISISTVEAISGEAASTAAVIATHSIVTVSKLVAYERRIQTLIDISTEPHIALSFISIIAYAAVVANCIVTYCIVVTIMRLIVTLIKIKASCAVVSHSEPRMTLALKSTNTVVTDVITYSSMQRALINIFAQDAYITRVVTGGGFVSRETLAVKQWAIIFTTVELLQEHRSTSRHSKPIHTTICFKSEASQLSAGDGSVIGVKEVISTDRAPGMVDTHLQPPLDRAVLSPCEICGARSQTYVTSGAVWINCGVIFTDDPGMVLTPTTDWGTVGDGELTVKQVIFRATAVHVI
jgi:hypothetical protein